MLTRSALAAGLATTIMLAAGCAVVNTIDPSAAIKTEFASSASAENTYRRVLAALRDCYPARMRIEADYYPEAKAGDITVIGGEMPSRIEFFRVEVRPAGSGATVVYLTGPGGWKDAFSAGFEPWSRGSSEVCPHGTKPDPDPHGNYRGDPKN